MKKLFDDLGENFVGLWKFNEYGKQKLYSVTLNVEGYYWDTGHHKTPEKALIEASKVLKKALRDLEVDR